MPPDDYDGDDEFLPPPQKARPWWVRAGLWRVPGRGAAWGYFAVSVLLAAASPVLATVTGNEWFYLGTGFVLSAAWYAAAINWVDRNGSWE